MSVSDWEVEIVANEAALKIKLNALRAAGTGIQKIIFHPGTGFAVTYLRPTNNFLINPAIGFGTESFFKRRIYAVNPWSADDKIVANGNYLSIAAFGYFGESGHVGNDRFLIASTSGGWIQFGQSYRKNEGVLSYQIKDPAGNIIKKLTMLGTSTYGADTATLKSGDVVVTWIDTSDNNVKFAVISSEGIIRKTTTVGITSGITQKPFVSASTGGIFTILYAPLGNGNLQTVVYNEEADEEEPFNPAYAEIFRPEVITDINFSEFNVCKDRTSEPILTFVDKDSGYFGFAKIDGEGAFDSQSADIVEVSSSMPVVAFHDTDNSHMLYAWYDNVAEIGMYTLYDDRGSPRDGFSSPKELGNGLYSAKPHHAIKLQNGGVVVLCTGASPVGTGWLAEFYAPDTGYFIETVFLGSYGSHVEDFIFSGITQLKGEQIVACSSFWDTDAFYSILNGGIPKAVSDWAIKINGDQGNVSWDGNTWSFDDNAALDVVGTWAVDYRPTIARIYYSGAGPTAIYFKDVSDNVIGSGGEIGDGDPISLDFSGIGDIDYLSIESTSPTTAFAKINRISFE